MNSRSVVCLLLLSTSVFAQSNARQFKASSSGLNLAPAVAYSSAGYEPRALAIADVNRDGKPDLIMANYCGSSSCKSNASVSVLLGNGDGTFRAAVNYNSGQGTAAAVAVADFNGDGKPDIVVVGSNCCNLNYLSVLLGNGDGTFKAAVSYDTGGSFPDSVAVADVNKDGKLDLIVANSYGSINTLDGSVGVLLGNGDGTFQPAVSYDSGGHISTSVAVADVNGDGNPDVLVANNCASNQCGDDGSVGVLLGNGDGTFETAVPYDSGGGAASSLAVADVNGDHKLDVVIVNNSEYVKNPADGSVGVLLGNGDGTFQPVATYDSGGNQPLSVAVADVNGDGSPDLLVANFCASATNCEGILSVLLGNANGTFQTAVNYGSGGINADAVAIADVNRDGKPDIVVANRCAFCSAGSAGVLLNNSLGLTTTSLSSSLNPSYYGQPVTFTVKVASVAFKITPTGTVSLESLGSVTLNAKGMATLTTSTLSVGVDSFTPLYSGDKNFRRSTQGVLFSQTVYGAKVSPTSLNYGNQTVGVASPYMTATLTNLGPNPLPITSITVVLKNGSYTTTTTCGSELLGGASCSYSLSWTPARTGAMSGTISFADPDPSGPQKVTLKGTGI